VLPASPDGGSDLCNPEEAVRTKNRTYRSAVAVALAAAVILAWLSLGVGVIGADGDPANLMYFGVLAIGIIGATIARFQPDGMARALFATAIAQALVVVIALVAGLGYPASPPLEILILNGFFIALFVGSALLFRNAARAKPLSPRR
jgi:peptidoglycan/LPS O-acetylase OafA/YrhL